MAVIRLANGDLVLHSPCRPSDELAQEIAALGPVAHVIAPNWFHDLYLAGYRKLYPDAVFWGCRRLRKHIDREIDGGSAPPWAQELLHYTLSGLLTFDESIFFHRATRTLIVADLLLNENITPQSPFFTKLGLRIFGVDGTVKLFPVLRLFGSGAARRSVRAAAVQIAQWEPQRLIVAHGTPVTQISCAQIQKALQC